MVGVRVQCGVFKYPDTPMTPNPHTPRRIAVIGAGIAGVSAARVLAQAGHDVQLFEKSPAVGGRMATRNSPFGGFDHGAQYFTVRDARFEAALAATPGLCRPWSATRVHLLDAHGAVAEPDAPRGDTHWVPVPAMRALVQAWAADLGAAQRVHLGTRVQRLAPDALHPQRWQLHTQGPDDAAQVVAGFDAVLLALPSVQARELLQLSNLQPGWMSPLDAVQMAPCWTVLVAFPQAMQPGLGSLGPQWNAARSTHHRVAWLARESSKPGREGVERWTIQASATWSTEHLSDTPERVQDKLLRAFAEITGIRAQPAHIDSQRWLFAQTTQALGQTHLWDASVGLGLCGDWCIGHRVEDAFLSGQALGLAAV